MIKIGILGKIGSGKSYISKMFGCPVFNADEEVIKIYKTDKKCFNKLKKKLPDYIHSFPIKKNELQSAILDNQRNLFKINKIVHPIVRNKMKKFLIINSNKKMVVLDIPLLLENKLNKKNYILIYVNAKKKQILKRLKLRKNYNSKILKKLEKTQLKLEQKRKKSNFIINNNFKKNTVRKSVKLILRKILN